MRKTQKVLLLALAVVFSIGLIFSSLELPFVMHDTLVDHIHFPGYDQQFTEVNVSKTQLYIEHYHLKEIGYAGLLVIVILIVTGFVAGKNKWSLIGALGIFLPVFSHFAATMFFLAGLGFLRILYIPLTDLSPTFLRLGDVVYIPFNCLVDLGWWLGLNPVKGIAIFFIVAGVFIFTGGVYTWLKTHFDKQEVARSFIYRISRHPQYLGWILWSYGLFLIPVDQPKKSWGFPDSLPFLLSSMVIITIALMEELYMTKKYGDSYRQFKSGTAFMIPLPYWLKTFLKHPLYLFFGRGHIEKKRHVFSLVGYYTFLLIVISYLHISWNDPTIRNPIFNARHEKQMAAYIHTLRNDQERRPKDIASYHLPAYGTQAVQPLIKSLEIKDFHTRNYTIRALGHIGDTNATEPILTALHDSSVDVRYSAIHALHRLNAKHTAKLIFSYLFSGNEDIMKRAAAALGAFGYSACAPVLLNQYDSLSNHAKCTYLLALGKLKYKPAIPLIVRELKAESNMIAETAVMAVLYQGDPSLIPTLQAMTQHNNWEIRMYANQVIKVLETKTD